MSNKEKQNSKDSSNFQIGLGQTFSEKAAINIARRTLWFTVFLILLLICLIFIFLHINPFGKIIDYNVSQTGQFGDTFNGLIGPVIAFCAAILTFLAFYIQYEANKIQRNGLAVQQFDNTFFNLLSNHHQVVNNIDEIWTFDTEKGHAVGKNIKGRVIFKNVAYSIKEIFDATEEKYRETNFALQHVTGMKDKLKIDNPIEFFKNDLSTMPQDLDKLDYIFSIFYGTYRSAFSHYFRNLYHIIKYIDEYDGFNGLYSNEKIKSIKTRYIKIVRAQLSSYELILLWYNSMQEFGRNFGTLMIKHELLDNIDFSAEIVLPEELRSQHTYLNQATN